MHGGAGESMMRTVDDRRPSHRIKRRTGLPSSRAVAGALLVAISVVGLFASWRQSQAEPTTRFVVATRTVAAGHEITAADVDLRTVSLPADIAELTLADLDQAIGTVAVETVRPGQLVQFGAVTAIAEPGIERFEVSLELPRSRAVDGRLRAGEPVDIVATFDSGGTSCTSVLVDDARVVALSGADADLVTGRGGSVTVTLAIDDPDGVLAAVFAADESEITLIRATTAPSRSIDGTFCSPGSSEAGS